MRVPNRMRLKSLLPRVAIAVCCLSSSAVAQPLGSGQLPPSLVTKTGELSQSELRQLRDFVAQHAADLTSSDNGDRSSARQALGRPLRNSNVSVQFRLAYSRALTDDLQAAFRSGDRSAKIGVLLLAGQIATDQAVRLGLDHLDDEDPIIRYQAAFSLGLTLDAVATRSPAITRAGVDRLIRALAERVGEETDLWVLDRVVRSMSAGLGISSQGFEGIKSSTMASLADGVATRVAALTGDAQPEERERPTLLVLLRAAEIAQQSLTTQSISDAEIVASARLGGELLAFVSRRNAAGDLSQDDRQLLIQITRTGENAIFFARSNHSQRRDTPSPTRIGDALANGDDDAFSRGLNGLVGSRGALTQPPFRLGPFKLN